MSANYGQPPMQGQSLDYWMNSEVARISPPSTPSFLRNLAWSFGQWRGFAGAIAGVGIVCLGASLLVAVWQVQIVWLWVGLLLLGLVLTALGPWISARKIAKIARLKSPMLSRAAGSIAAGVGTGLFLSAVFVVLASFAIGPWFQQGFKGMASAALVYALIVILMFSVFVLPGYFSQHARRDFRRHIDKNGQLRKELENLAPTWIDPRGNSTFGPL